MPAPIMHEMMISAALTELAVAGVGEFARQWLLVNRTAEYQPGSGRHDLVMTVGGSAGHSSRWAVRVNEGRPGDGERTWGVSVSSLTPDVGRVSARCGRGLTRSIGG